MTVASLAVIAVTIVATSFFSGVFGMVGGVVLLFVLLVYFDVATAMVALSIIQLAANGWRCFLWRSYVRWGLFVGYCLGALITFVAMRFVAFVPDKALVYIGLGILPFAVEAIPPRWRPNIERRGVPFFTGVSTTIVQIVSGGGGPFLDIFYQKSLLDRKTTVATKAATQTFAHIARIAYFGSLGGFTDQLSVWWFVVAVLLAIFGTSLAPFVLHRMTDTDFRKWTRWIILVVGVLSLARGLSLIFGV
jgi:uncharacterized protein